MIESNVKATGDGNTVCITKGNSGVLVAVRGIRCLVVSTTHTVNGDVPFVPFVYGGTDFLKTRKQFLEEVGELILEKADSRFFDKPVWVNHCKNGHPSSVSRSEWEALAREVLAEYNASSSPEMETWLKTPPTGKDFDSMEPAAVVAYIDAVDFATLYPVLDACSFACIKRVYEKYYGHKPVSTEPRERVINAFNLTKVNRSRNAKLIGPCV